MKKIKMMPKTCRYALLLILLAACQTETKQKVDLAITNANVIHLETGKVEVQDIYISNGKIKAVKMAKSESGFEADSTIDATGKYVLPGFWDNHIHLRGGDSLIANNKNFLKLFIANGVTTVRDAGGDLTESVMNWKEQIASENLIGPTIFTAGPNLEVCLAAIESCTSGKAVELRHQVAVSA